MVSVLTIHYHVEKALHRIHTSLLKDVSSVDIDSYFNQAKNIILDRYDELVEKNRKLEQHLRILEVDDYPLTLNKKTDEYNLYELPKNYYNYLRLSAKGCSAECTDPQSIRTTTYTSKDDLNESLKDSFRKPSWYFRRGIYNFVENKVKFYHLNQYELKEVYLSYVRYLPDVAAASLVKGEAYLASDGITVIKENQHLDLPPESILWSRMCELTAVLIKRDLDDNYKPNIETFLFNQSVGMND